MTPSSSTHKEAASNVGRFKVTLYPMTDVNLTSIGWTIMPGGPMDTTTLRTEAYVIADCAPVSRATS